MTFDAASGIHYNLQGQGPALVLGFPYFASFDAIMPAGTPDVAQTLCDALASRYRVLRLDYPSIGSSHDIPGNALSAERTARDLLSVVNDAGFQRFAYFGYSWGAAAGLQLAARTDRLSALALGGWPPRGGQYALCLEAAREQLDDPPPEVQVVLREPAQYAQWIHFYESVAEFREDDLIEKLRADGVACLAFVGAEGDVAAGSRELSNASILRREAAYLRARGWQIEFIEGAGHEVGLDARAMLNILEPFLASALPVLPERPEG